MAKMSKQEVKGLQRDLNDFVKSFVRGGREPLPVDGVKGFQTNERIRDCKFWLGFGEHKINADVDDEFRWALKHPRRVQKGDDKKRPKRGKQRRKRHRARHQTKVRKAIRKRSDKRFAGSRYFTNRVIDISDKHRKTVIVTSRKRPILLGNTGSDHNFFQRLADAVDEAFDNDQRLMDIVADELGGPNDVNDFQHFTLVNPQNGRHYRAQLIAVTHGTGPHFHSGFRRI